MNTTDIILLILLFGFVWAGFWYGLIQTLGGIVGVIAGAVIAGRTYAVAAGWLGGAGARAGLAEWLAFSVIFVIVNRAVAMATGSVGKILNVVKVVPLVGSANRLGGALVGLVEGLLVLGLIIAMAQRFELSPQLVELLDNSRVANFLSAIGSSLMPLLPTAIRGVRSILQV
ncbi:CvpA family protein [Candidatus Parcubacteria bacterium]|jgi:membrane protein required for colicin V production|nr:MAG: CvpA family protein [Candidatus Parcubacteria bacterium]